MQQTSERYKNIMAKDSYFIGANTPTGFVNEIKNHVSEDTDDRVYILKGTPGCGKSTLMKKLAKEAEENGAFCTRLYCSSDPESLDGIVLQKNGVSVAVTDGTAPHSGEPVYSGAVGRYVDLSTCIDNVALESRKEEIISLAKEKKQAYKSAYRYLRAAGEVSESALYYSSLACKKEKLLDAASRLSHEISRIAPKLPGPSGVIHKRTLAVSMKGNFRLTTFEQAKIKIAVKDTDGMSQLFYSVLIPILVNDGAFVTVSEFPTGGVGEIMIPSHDVSVVPFHDGGDYAKTINLGRFTDRKTASQYRMRRRFSEKCLSALMEEAGHFLSDAGGTHFKTEEIYKEHTDFSEIDRITLRLSDEISTILG